MKRYHAKLDAVVQHADEVLTLSRTAADQLPAARKAPRVVPHGHALALHMLPKASIAQRDGPLALFGALRPNRALRATVLAWRRLPRAGRPDLRILLRSVTETDELRDGELLRFLRRAAEDPQLRIDLRSDMVPDHTLVDWLRGSSALVLPYRHISHSGQLELAIDCGMPVLAPEVPTLRSQLDAGGHRDHPVVWFPPELLTDPTFGMFLTAAARQEPRPNALHRAVAEDRRVEHHRLQEVHCAAYGWPSGSQ